MANKGVTTTGFHTGFQAGEGEKFQWNRKEEGYGRDMCTCNINVDDICFGRIFSSSLPLYETYIASVGGYRKSQRRSEQLNLPF